MNPKTLGALTCPLICTAFILALSLVIIISMWKVFVKAGQPGWACIVPFYNSYILTCEIAKKEVLWFILQFVPFVGIVAHFIVALEVAKRFGKSEAYGVGLALLPYIFYPMLAFSDAEYQGGRVRRRDEDFDDDDDYDNRPRRNSRDDEDNEDDRPRRRSRHDDDDDHDDRPRRRSRHDDDDDYDDRPRRR
jgi:hypothetical protein